MTITGVAVVGAGTMGGGIAQKLASEGLRVVLIDTSREKASDAKTRAEMSLVEGLERGVTYAQAGADLIWVDLGYDESVRDELTAISEKVAPHAPVVANMTENVGRPMLTTYELHRMGFKLITYPLTLILTAAKAMTEAMDCLARKGTTLSMAERMMPVKEFRSIVRMERIQELERQLERGQRDDQASPSRRDSDE